MFFPRPPLKFDTKQEKEKLVIASASRERLAMTHSTFDCIFLWCKLFLINKARFLSILDREMSFERERKTFCLIYFFNYFEYVFLETVIKYSEEKNSKSSRFGFDMRSEGDVKVRKNA